MTPKNRARDYEKRRYEEWQARLAAKQARNRQARRTAGIVGTALLAVLVIGGVFLLFKGNNPKSTAAAPAATSPAATGSPSPAQTAKSTCPATNPQDQDTSGGKQYAQVPKAAAAQNKHWTWTVETTCGTITADLDGTKAPQAVASTLFLSKSGFWDNTPCHRLTTQGIFVLQCGDPTGSGSGGPGYSYGPVENAPKSDVYPAGTIAMARQGGKGDSMGSQFFLVYKESTIPSDAAGGYTVLGKITKGLDVVKKVAAGGVTGGGSDGAPVSAVNITSTSAAAG